MKKLLTAVGFYFFLIGHTLYAQTHWINGDRYELAEDLKCEQLIIDGVVELISKKEEALKIHCDSIHFKSGAKVVYDGDLDVVVSEVHGNVDFEALVAIYPASESPSITFNSAAKDGAHGGNGGGGRDASCKIKWGIPKCHGTTGGGHGGHGSNGGHGQDGTHGKNGRVGDHASAINFTFEKLIDVEQIRIVARGGDGEDATDGTIGQNGGNGGNGGRGGRGGSGKYGRSSSRGGNGGRGGIGGNGGNGGNGGHGGNGGNGAVIEITYDPKTIFSAFKLSKIDFDLQAFGGNGAKGGIGAAGGQAGKGGSRGREGQGGDGRWFEGSGGSGLAGTPGADGQKGENGKNGEHGVDGEDGKIFKPAVWVSIGKKKKVFNFEK